MSIELLEEEEFRVILGYEGYSVSNYGRVISLKRTKVRKDRLLNPFNHQAGYKIVALRKDNITTKFSVHRLVAKTFIPNTENKPQVNHLNGIRHDNRVENLEWCTNQENAIHAFSILPRNKAFGERMGSNVLKEQQVHEIRSLLKKGHSRMCLSRLYKVGGSTIQAIDIGKSWKYLPEKYIDDNLLPLLPCHSTKKI